MAREEDHLLWSCTWPFTKALGNLLQSWSSSGGNSSSGANGNPNSSFASSSFTASHLTAATQSEASTASCVTVLATADRWILQTSLAHIQTTLEFSPDWFSNYRILQDGGENGEQLDNEDQHACTTISISTKALLDSIALLMMAMEIKGSTPSTSMMSNNPHSNNNNHYPNAHPNTTTHHSYMTKGMEWEWKCWDTRLEWILRKEGDHRHPPLSRVVLMAMVPPQDAPAWTEAFGQTPVVARWLVSSARLLDWTELLMVPGGTQVRMTFGAQQWEWSAVGHSSRCQVLWQAEEGDGHKAMEIIQDSDDEGDEDDQFTTTTTPSKRLPQSKFSRVYPLAALQRAMRPLEQATETCLSVNRQGILAIQHQMIGLDNVVAYCDSLLVPLVDEAIVDDHDDDDDQDDPGVMVDDNATTVSVATQHSMRSMATSSSKRLRSQSPARRPAPAARARRTSTASSFSLNAQQPLTASSQDGGAVVLDEDEEDNTTIQDGLSVRGSTMGVVEDDRSIATASVARGDVHQEASSSRTSGNASTGLPAKRSTTPTTTSTPRPMLFGNTSNTTSTTTRPARKSTSPREGISMSASDPQQINNDDSMLPPQDTTTTETTTPRQLRSQRRQQQQQKRNSTSEVGGMAALSSLSPTSTTTGTPMPCFLDKKGSKRRGSIEEDDEPASPTSSVDLLKEQDETGIENHEEADGSYDQEVAPSATGAVTRRSTNGSTSKNSSILDTSSTSMYSTTTGNDSSFLGSSSHHHRRQQRRLDHRRRRRSTSPLPPQQPLPPTQDEEDPTQEDDDSMAGNSSPEVIYGES